ncbi:hypothetical protein BE20_17005 [Sorangium cellulosum]|nr:hypothetical protein BE20_17005 [Sorangium cellulosum]
MLPDRVSPVVSRRGSWAGLILAMPKSQLHDEPGAPLALGEEQVGGLDVAHDAGLVRLLQADAGLRHDPERDPRGQRAEAREELREIFAAEQLHHQEEPVSRSTPVSSTRTMCSVWMALAALASRSNRSSADRLWTISPFMTFTATRRPCSASSAS